MSPPPTADRPVHPPTRPLQEWASPQPARSGLDRPRRLLRVSPSNGYIRARVSAGRRPRWTARMGAGSTPTLAAHSFHTASTVSDESTSVPSMSSGTARQLNVLCRRRTAAPTARASPPITTSHMARGRPTALAANPTSGGRSTKESDTPTPVTIANPRPSKVVRAADRNNSGTTFAIPKPVHAQPAITQTGVPPTSLSFRVRSPGS